MQLKKQSYDTLPENGGGLCYTPELLSPAGSREQLEAAVRYGANAVYLGGNSLSLRSKSDGFSGSNLISAIDFAHAANVKVYYCINALPPENFLPGVHDQLEFLADTQVDGIIAADPGVIRLARQICPDIELHLSTQAHSVNSEAVSFWKEAGISRINLARELSFTDMQLIMGRHPEMDFEIFVHGAMCLSLSGHCLLSAWVNNRPANLGLCTQPCRFEYRGMQLSVEEKKRNGEKFFDIVQGENFSAIWAPMDLCLVRWLDKIVTLRPAAIKIEGRTKTGSYAALVTDVYRTALNEIKTASRLHSADDFVEELLQCASRPLCSGFFFEKRVVEQHPNIRPLEIVAQIGTKNFEGSWNIRLKKRWDSGIPVRLVLPGMSRPEIPSGAYALEDTSGRTASLLHPGSQGMLRCEDNRITQGIYIMA